MDSADKNSADLNQTAKESSLDSGLVDSALKDSRIRKDNFTDLGAHSSLEGKSAEHLPRVPSDNPAAQQFRVPGHDGRKLFTPAELKKRSTVVDESRSGAGANVEDLKKQERPRVGLARVRPGSANSSGDNAPSDFGPKFRADNYKAVLGESSSPRSKVGELGEAKNKGNLKAITGDERVGSQVDNLSGDIGKAPRIRGPEKSIDISRNPETRGAIVGSDSHDIGSESNASGDSGFSKHGSSLNSGATNSILPAERPRSARTDESGSIINEKSAIIGSTSSRLAQDTPGAIAGVRSNDLSKNSGDSGKAGLDSNSAKSTNQASAAREFNAQHPSENITDKNQGAQSDSLKSGDKKTNRPHPESVGDVGSIDARKMSVSSGTELSSGGNKSGTSGAASGTKSISSEIDIHAGKNTYSGADKADNTASGHHVEHHDGASRAPLGPGNRYDGSGPNASGESISPGSNNSNSIRSSDAGDVRSSESIVKNAPLSGTGQVGNVAGEVQRGDLATRNDGRFGGSSVSSGLGAGYSPDGRSASGPKPGSDVGMFPGARGGVLFPSGTGAGIKAADDLISKVIDRVKSKGNRSSRVKSPAKSKVESQDKSIGRAKTAERGGKNLGNRDGAKGRVDNVDSKSLVSRKILSTKSKDYRGEDADKKTRSVRQNQQIDSSDIRNNSSGKNKTTRENPRDRLSSRVGTVGRREARQGAEFRGLVFGAPGRAGIDALKNGFDNMRNKIQELVAKKIPGVLKTENSKNIDSSPFKSATAEKNSFGYGEKANGRLNVPFKSPVFANPIMDSTGSFSLNGRDYTKKSSCQAELNQLNAKRSISIGGLIAAPGIRVSIADPGIAAWESRRGERSFPGSSLHDLSALNSGNSNDHSIITTDYKTRLVSKSEPSGTTRRTLSVASGCLDFVGRKAVSSNDLGLKSINKPKSDASRVGESGQVAISGGKRVSGDRPSIIDARPGEISRGVGDAFSGRLPSIKMSYGDGAKRLNSGSKSEVQSVKNEPSLEIGLISIERKIGRFSLGQGNENLDSGTSGVKQKQLSEKMEIRGFDGYSPVLVGLKKGTRVRKSRNSSKRIKSDISVGKVPGINENANNSSSDLFFPPGLSLGGRLLDSRCTNPLEISTSDVRSSANSVRKRLRKKRRLKLNSEMLSLVDNFVHIRMKSGNLRLSKENKAKKD